MRDCFIYKKKIIHKVNVRYSDTSLQTLKTIGFKFKLLNYIYNEMNC